MKFIKKNLSKILICLSLCLTLLFTLCFNVKTYAFNNVAYSNTINYVSLVQFQSSSTNEFGGNSYVPGLNTAIYDNNIVLYNNSDVSNSSNQKIGFVYDSKFTIDYDIMLCVSVDISIIGTTYNGTSNWKDGVSDAFGSSNVPFSFFSFNFNGKKKDFDTCDYKFIDYFQFQDISLDVYRFTYFIDNTQQVDKSTFAINLPPSWNNNYNAFVFIHNIEILPVLDISNEFNDLNEQYIDITRDLNDYRNFVKYGTLTFTKNFNFYTGNQDVYFTLGELYNTNYYTYNNIHITEWFRDNENDDDEHRGFILTFNNNVVYLNNINLAFITSEQLSPTTCYITFNDNGVIRNFLLPFNNNINVFGVNGKGYDLTSKNLIDYFTTNNVVFSENYYIESIQLSDFPIRDNIDYDFDLYIFPFDSDSYNIGYNDAKIDDSYKIGGLERQINDLNNTINDKNQSIDDLSSQITSLQNSVNILQSSYNDLNNSYQNLLNGNNFANLFFTIAQTPFESFKTIWNVDFLGVNLAGFVTGILFIGLIIWLIKKVF